MKRCFSDDRVFKCVSVMNTWGLNNDPTLNRTTMFAPPVGSEYFNRIGSRIGLKRLLVNAQVSLSYFNAGIRAGEMCRFAFVYDRQPNNVVPSTDDIFWDVWPGVAAHGDAKAFPFVPNMDRFEILYSKCFSMPRIGINGADVPSQGYINWNQEPLLMELDIDLSGRDMVLGPGNEIRSGAILFIFQDDAGDAASPALQVGGHFRLEFYDI